MRRVRQSFTAVAAPLRDPDPIDGFADAVDELVKLLKSSGIRSVLLGQPVLWSADATDEELASLWLPVKTLEGPVRPNPAWLAQEMAKYNAVQRSIAEQHDVPYVDLDARIPKNLDYYFDDCHFTDKGSHAVADEILDTVQKEVTAVSKEL
jgi:lysophospholipase L1-like esterase